MPQACEGAAREGPPQDDRSPAKSNEAPRSHATLARLDATAAVLGMLPDPLTEIEMRRQLAREAYERGRTDGWRQGYEHAEADMARRWREIAEPVARGGITYGELEARRWGPGGREHFADPHPGDHAPMRARDRKAGAVA